MTVPLSRIVSLCVVLAFLSACSSSGTLEVVQDKSAAIPPGKTVALSVTSGSDEDSLAIASLIKGALFGRLVSEGVFRQVVHTPEPADYTMTVDLLSAFKATGMERVFVSALLGPDKLAAAVSLHEQATGEQVLAINVTGEAALHQWSPENDVEDAVREAVNRIILALQ